MKTIKLVKYIQVTWKLPHEKFPNLNVRLVAKLGSLGVAQLHPDGNTLDSTTQVSTISSPIS